MAGGVSPERVILVRAGVPGGDVSVGSGTLVGPKLVLTAAHVVFGDDAAPLGQVRVGPPDRRLVAGRVMWPGSFNPESGPLEHDAALVEIIDEAWVPPRLGPVRWGRITGRSPGVECEVTGFPRVLRDPDGTRDSDQVSATINPGSRRVAGRHDLHVTSSVPRELDGPSPWAGASGAGVFASGLLIGVLLVDERGGFAGDRLSALPVHRVAQEAKFRELVSGHGGGLATMAEIGSVELDGLVVPPVGTRERGRGPDRSLVGLLRPDAEAVPFHGRQDLLDELRGWCAEPELVVDVRLLVGPGGQGKTRLVRRLAQQLAGQTTGRSWWLAGLLEPDPDPPAIAHELSSLADSYGPLLVVVDYAETRAGQVARLMRALWHADLAASVRVLLVARAAGDWWIRLTDELQLAGDGIIKMPGLDPLADSAAGFPAAVAAFANRLADVRPEVDWHPLTDAPAPPPDLTDVRYRSPLTLQLAALTALLEAADHLAPSGGEPAEETVLRHERRYWREVAAPAGLELSDDTLSDTVAVANLAGAPSRGEAASSLSAVAGLRGLPSDTLGRINTWLRDLYPPAAGHWWGGLQPDRVAEYQAGTRLLHDPALLPGLMAAASQIQRQHVLTVLARALINPALTTDQADQLAVQLSQTIHDHLADYGPAALEVATQAPNPDRLLAAIEQATTDAETTELEALAGELPPASLALAHLAELLTSRLVCRYRTRASTAADPDDDARLDLAIALNNQSNRLAELGRREEALASVEEAVTLFRELAAARPDAFTPDLATALSNQANRLAALGRREEALAAVEEAVTLRRQLAAARPDAFTPDLATALNNQANRLAALGRREEALTAGEEAVTLYRELAGARPDASTPHLAIALSNHSLRLAALARLEEALAAVEEAVTLYRELAGARPDVFTPDLAAVLNNQSNRLAALGRSEEALASVEEALTLRRQLAAARPDVFTPDLAGALNNRFNRLAELGRRREEALAAVEEAVRLRRELAVARPDVFTPDLAGALNNQSNRLADLGWREEALAAVEEAVRLYRDLAAARPDAFTRDLAGALTTLGVRLTEEGRDDDAMQADREAIKLYRIAQIS